MTKICVATTKKGNLCRLAAEYGDLCLPHAAQAGAPDALARQRHQAERGRAAKLLGRVAGKRRARRPKVAAPALDPRIPPGVLDFVRHYLPFSLSAAWTCFIAVLYGLTGCHSAGTAQTIFGFDTPNPAGYSVAEVVAGRRSGKSAVGAALALFECVVRGPEHMKFLAPGQRGYVVVVSRTQRQALEFFRYARAIVERNAELAVLLECGPLESQNGGELRFRGGITLSVLPASKSVRGYTFVAAFLDEWAFVASDELSADQDAAILTAIEYGMTKPVSAPTRRMLIISSAGPRAGVVYENHSKFFGNPNAPVLVAHGPTWTWNTSITRESLEPQRLRNPDAFDRELGAQFRDTVSQWCASVVIVAATNERSDQPLPPGPWKYVTVADLAFKRDRCVQGVGHFESLPGVRSGPQPVTGVWDPVLQREVLTVQTSQLVDRKFVVDGLWWWTPTPNAPLDAPSVVQAMAAIARAYRCRRIVADQFAIVPLQAEFARHGLPLVEFTMTSKSKLGIFTHLREKFYAGAVSMPALDLAVRELVELQERITVSGNIQIGHPDRATAHDDFAHAVALLHHELLESGREVPSVEYGRVDWFRR